MPGYLRVLDAVCYGADKNEISEEVFPEVDNAYPDYLGSKRVDNAYASAVRIRDGDYRWLGFVE